MNNLNDSTIINICIVPNKLVSDLCIDISQNLTTPETMFALGSDKFAHMTVFMARFANTNINKVVDAARCCLVDVGKFNCEHTGYLLTEGRYLEASYRKSPELIELHELLIKNISPLRINPGSPYEEGYFLPYSDKQKQNAIETGYDLAYDLYRPHITLTRYSIAPEEIPEMSNADLSFNTNRICIYKADDNGAVYELIEDFDI